MSSLGKQTRLKRIFSHPSGRILSVAIDHLVNYSGGMPDGLKYLERSIDKIVEGNPNAITMLKGTAMRYMPKYAGKVPYIIQQIGGRPDDKYFFPTCSVEEVIALGADAIAVAVILKNKTESVHLKHLSDVITESERYGLPVIAHIYPVGAEGEGGIISNLAEDVAYAARIGIELGVDVVKIPYTGDINSFKDIVSLSPVPIVAAGGPKCNNLEESVKMIEDIVQTGGAGATVGRNVWGYPDIPMVIGKLKKAMFD